VAGFVAYDPVKTPLFSFPTLRDTRSCFAAAATYASTSPRCSSVVRAGTNGCSGASTRYVAPKIVSGRVVKTRIPPACGTRSSTPCATVALPAIARTSCTRKMISAPSDRPIQFR
jgi:hypothetical protein